MGITQSRHSKETEKGAAVYGGRTRERISASPTKNYSKNTQNVRRVMKQLVLFALIILLALSENKGQKGLFSKVTTRLQILGPVHAKEGPEERSVNANNVVTEGNNKESKSNGKYVITPSMSLVRRRHIALSPFIEADVYGDVTLVVLDTEGLVYHTSFTRKLLWVTKVTENLLNIVKPSVHNDPHTCAIDHFAINSLDWIKNSRGSDAKTTGDNEQDDASCHKETKRPTLGRHLVPSYDGYIYCVYENNDAQLLHIHVRDIVNYTPFRTPLLEGVYLEGSRHSSVMALDYDTGQYITRNPTPDGMSGGIYAKLHGKDVKTPRQLHIGYTDWNVRAFDEKTHDELWSFNWREIGSVNSEHLDAVTVERIREVVKVKGKTLFIRYDENDEEATDELNFPFQIAAVFAVMWNVDQEIMTLQVLERISLPPPPEFLKNSLDAAFSTLSLKSSNYAGNHVLSVKNGVINIDDTLDAKKRAKEHPSDGSLIEIKTVDPQHYYASDTQVQRISIIKNTHTKRNFMKLWVIFGWLITFSAIPFTWLVRKVNKCFGVNILFWKVIDRVPFLGKLIDRMTRTLLSIEKTAFDSTESFIFNIDRASQIYPVDAVYKKLTGTSHTHSKEMQLRGSVNNRAQLALLNTLHNMTIAANAGTQHHNDTQNAGEVPINQPPSASTIKSISVVPTSTPLAGFLENGRFIRTFEVMQILGKGGFGSVYMVQHKLEPDRPIYAMKFVLLWLKPSEGLGSRKYFREVSANREIYSKYVVRYFTWWCEEPHFLPMMQLAPEIRSAAAGNIKHLINTNALTSQNTKELTGYLQQYQDAVREIVERSGEDSYPSFSKIAFNRTTREQLRRNRATLEAIGEHSEASNDWHYYTDDSINDSVARRLQDMEDENASLEDDEDDVSFSYSDSGVDIVFEDSQPNENKPEAENVDIFKAGKPRNKAPLVQQNASDQHYPVILMIMMELCKGYTLREWLNRKDRSEVPLDYQIGPTGIPVEFFLIKQLMKGLRDIHANNFIHRDLKPENIFVDPETYALKIGDFGLVAIISHANEDNQGNAHAMNTEDGDQSSQSGQIIGTPGYTAPEGGVNCTEKADIYSASLILLEILLPKFTTSMERLTVLENFRNSRAVPAYIEDGLKPWYDLLWQMGDPIPTRRPTAAVVHRTLKVILGLQKD